MQLLNLFVFVGKEELFFPWKFKLPRLLRYRVCNPPTKFCVVEKEKKYQVLRNNQPVIARFKYGKKIIATFESEHIAKGFVVACKLLEMRFQ